MDEKAQTVEDFRRYEQLIASAIAPPPVFAATVESATALQVERGIVLASAVLGADGPAHLSSIDQLIELAPSQRLGQIAVIDAAGHHRPVYRPLLVNACLTAFSIRYESLPREQFGRWEEGLRSWCDLLEADLGRISVSETVNPAARGASIAEAAWIALALHTAGKLYVRDAWIDLASDTFGRLTRAQQPAGSFLLAARSDHPEPAWYHELSILHAAAGYAVRAEDRNAARAVSRSADFHLAETQPDHASSQPWGLFAFIWNPRTRPLADQLIHSTSLNRGAGNQLDGASLILLADTLYCLRLFL